MKLPFIDPLGYAHDGPARVEKKGRKHRPLRGMQYLSELAERSVLSPVERYGSPTFGLKGKEEERDDWEGLGFHRNGRGKSALAKSAFKEGRTIERTWRSSDVLGSTVPRETLTFLTRRMPPHMLEDTPASDSHAMTDTPSTATEYPPHPRGDISMPRGRSQRAFALGRPPSRSYRTAPSFAPRLDHTTSKGRPPPYPPTRHLEPPQLPADAAPEVRRPWQPTKKLTFAAMAGLKALHRADPENFSRSVLSERFGISMEAVRRILRSDYRQRDADDGDVEARPATRVKEDGRSLKGTKWDRSNLTAESYSPVPAIMRAYVDGPSRRPMSLDPAKFTEKA